MNAKRSTTSTPTFPSPSPAALCSDAHLFKQYLSAHNVEWRQKGGSPPELMRVDATGKFDIRIINSSLPTTTDPQFNDLYDQLRTMFAFEAAPDQPPQDDFGICKNAHFLCTTWLRFKSVRANSFEMQLRRPIDAILEHLFLEEGGVHFEVEIPVTLPYMEEAMRKYLKLAPGSTAYLDTGIVSWAPCNLDKLQVSQRLAVRENPDLNALQIHTIARDDENYKGPHRIAMLDLGWEFKMNDARAVRNQVVLNGSTNLLHRRYVGMESRPLWGFAVNYRIVEFFTSEWDGDVPVVNEWQDSLKLNTFKGWVSLYLMLVRIRNSIVANPPSSINIYDALRRPAWRSATSKRGSIMMPSSPDFSRPTKRQKVNFASESDSDSVVGASQMEEGAADTLVAENVSQLRTPVPVHARVHDYILGLGLSDSIEPVDHPDRTEDTQQTFSNTA